MSLYNGPPRPGARGGRDQFSWENVKADKDREYYLGHSVKALAGRWQKGKDVYWYTREKGAGDAVQDEIQAVKQREEELMMEALGLKPKTVAKPAPQLDKHDIDELIKGKKDDEEQPDGAEAAAQEADRIKGLGYIAGTGGGLAEAVHTTLPGVGAAGAGVQTRPPPQQKQPAGPAGAAGPPGGSRPSAALALATGMTSAQLKELRRAEKRAKKEAKKEAKKAKKEAKKAKKEAKRARRDAKEPQQKEAEPDRKRRRKRSASGSSSSSSSDSSGSDSDGGDGARDRRQGGGGRAAEPVVRGERFEADHRRPLSRAEDIPQPPDRDRYWPADGGRRDAADRGRHLPHGRQQRGGEEERGRQGARDGDWERGWAHEREWERERGDTRAAHRHGYTEEGPGRHRHGAGPDEEDAGDTGHRGRVRHDSPRAPPRDAAGPPPAAQQRRQRHDSPDPGWEPRRSRSRSPIGRPRTAKNGAAVRGRSRSRSRSPARRRHSSRSPGPLNRGGRGHGRSRSPEERGRNRGDRGEEREAPGDYRRRVHRRDSRSPSRDRGGGR